MDQTDALIIFFGTVPPLVYTIILAYYSFKQGKKGYDVAISSRDAAMEEIKELKSELQQLKKDNSSITIPESVIQDLQKKLVAAVKGSYGQLVRRAKEEINEAVEEGGKELIENMDPAAKQQMIGQKFQGKIMDWVSAFLE